MALNSNIKNQYMLTDSGGSGGKIVGTTYVLSPKTVNNTSAVKNTANVAPTFNPNTYDMGLIGAGDYSKYKMVTPQAQQSGQSKLANLISDVSGAVKAAAQESAAQNASSGSSSTTTTGGGVSVPSNNSDYMNQLSSMLTAYQKQQQDALAAQQAEKEKLVRQAYGNNMSALENAYNSRMNSLLDTYNGTLDQLGNNYNYSADQIAQQAENALREAYINRMLSEKNLAQEMSAAGLTGGAAESTIARLLNNYGSARNNIETQRSNDLADLLNTYQNNLASARENYNNAANEVENSNYSYRRQLENDLANGVIGTYDNLYNALGSGMNTYANAMQGLAASQVNNAADLAATNYKNYLNALNKQSTSTSKTSNSSNANTADIAANVQAMIANGGNVSTILNDLIAKYGKEEAQAIAKAAGLI